MEVDSEGARESLSYWRHSLHLIAEFIKQEKQSPFCSARERRISPEDSKEEQTSEDDFFFF